MRSAASRARSVAALLLLSRASRVLPLAVWQQTKGRLAGAAAGCGWVRRRGANPGCAPASAMHCAAAMLLQSGGASGGRKDELGLPRAGTEGRGLCKRVQLGQQPMR